MANNTLYSDINELWLGYALNKNKWFDTSAEQQFKTRLKQSDVKLAHIQIERANVMASDCIKWAKSKGYSGNVSKVYWTARPGTIAKAVGKDVDQTKNPTDILVKFTKGPANGFLGVSAKSTNGAADIGFKNPGLGTVEKNLNIDLAHILINKTNEAVKKFKLPDEAIKRKVAIRSQPKVQAQTQVMGSSVLAKVADVMYAKLKSMRQPLLRDYLLENWMDSNNNLYPPYIKITGRGDKPGKFTSDISDPLKNNKLSAMLKDPIKLERIGSESIMVSAGSKKIFRIRPKFESEKMASGLKFSADPA